MWRWKLEKSLFFVESVHFAQETMENGCGYFHWTMVTMGSSLKRERKRIGLFVIRGW